MTTVNYFNKSRFKEYTISLARNDDIEKILTGQYTIHSLCNDIVAKTGSKLCSILTYPHDAAAQFNIIHSTDPRISFCKEMPILNIPFDEKICVISNSVKHDPRNKNFDFYNCPIKKFCGVPIIKKDPLVGGQGTKDAVVYGQIVLANRKKGYSINTLQSISHEIGLISSIIISQDDNFIFQDPHRNDLKILSAIAHEMYTPLHGTVSMLSLLPEVGELNDKQKDYISCALSSCEDLIEIVRDSIDFQKIKLGNLGIINDTFDLRKMMGDIINLVKFKSDRKGISIECTIDKKIPPTVYGDKNRLSQILLNIIGNAIKFTVKGQVVILVNQYPSRVIFMVQDTGCGIKRENLDKIFLEYQEPQDPNSVPTESGIGLGLALSKKLIQMMGGGITVESVASKGSTFTIDIPLAEERYKVGISFDESINILIIDENEKNRIQLRNYLFQWKVHVDIVSTFKEARKMLEFDSPSLYNIFIINISNLVESFAFTKWINATFPKSKTISVGGGTGRGSLNESSGSGSGEGQRGSGSSGGRGGEGGGSIFDGAIHDINDKLQVYNTILSVKNTKKKATGSSKPDLSSFKICIVEDDDISAFALHEILLANGIPVGNITIIDNGEQAVRNITHTRYDIIFMDCKLGSEMNGIKATKILKQSLPDLTIIGITASITDEEKLDWLNYGLDGYLTKPFTKNMIENVLQKYF